MKLTEYRKIQAEAHRIVSKAVIDGKLPKINGSTKCSDCDKPAVEYDHRDYLKPLEVEPVCHICNCKRGPALPVVTDYDQMPRIERETSQFRTCLRCGHEWFSRSKEEPKTCAHQKCRSPYWNKPRKERKP